MSYTPTEWKAGDVVTSEKLNHMEDGIFDSAEIFVVHAYVEHLNEPDENGYLEAYHLDGVEYQDIRDAISEGKVPILRMDTDRDSGNYYYALLLYSKYDGEITGTHIDSLNYSEHIHISSDGIEVYVEYFMHPVIVDFAALRERTTVGNGDTFAVDRYELSLISGEMPVVNIMKNHLPTYFYFASAEYVGDGSTRIRYTFTNGFEIIDIEKNASGGGGTATYYDNMSRIVEDQETT